ncbi:DNA methyltransferase [Buchananella felis]|uniref:DNA methyltransferase n=1 Tax=Buchananella felis TaxID=3231492 RepID=UPI003528B73B
MSAFESIQVVGDWVSDHYFTATGTETFAHAAAAVVKEWKAEKKEGLSTPLTRFGAGRVQLLRLLSRLGEEGISPTSAQASAALREILGFPLEPHAIAFERSDDYWAVSGVLLGRDPSVVWLDAEPIFDKESDLTTVGVDGFVMRDKKDFPISAAKVVSEIFLSETANDEAHDVGEVRFVVVSAGAHLFLAHRDRWAEGRYLRADVQLIAERDDTRAGGEVERFLSIFARRCLEPAADGVIWWEERLKESVTHAVGVSQDLRDGIRESIEIIANDVLARRRERGLDVFGVDGQELARQSLRFLYRILFLLYAEASPELGVVAKGEDSYDQGYGLDRLRELVQIDLTSARSAHGTHIYDSLALLFRLVNGDHPSQTQNFSTAGAEFSHVLADSGACANAERELAPTDGLTFEPLVADLFAPAATAMIDEVGLSNTALQQVLERLLLTKASKGERGFISYANLGINQLGAVYEGLMSYTGFVAREDLYEVAKNGDPAKGSWVVPTARAEGIDSKHFVKRTDPVTGILQPVVHRRGSFVFRLAGRERQQSASYYTPEVMTRFVVSQALEELLPGLSADQILELKVCEPALGSGAFAIEATRQLAAAYLERKQEELGEQIPAEDYATELLRVKAQIALHQVYGVDLNATAVELAEVSLWLDTMQPGLKAPWFGLHLRRGNSLIGARRSTYSARSVKDKAHLSSPGVHAPLTGLAEAMAQDRREAALVGRIHHFLLPAIGWGAACESKDVKEIAKAEQVALKAWRNAMRKKPTEAQIKRLQKVAARVETLWALAARRMEIANQQSTRFIDYWPHRRPTPHPVGIWGVSTWAECAFAPVSRAEIEASLANPNGAYSRLRRIMDAWCALWFWPLTEEVEPPRLESWIAALESLVGVGGKHLNNREEDTSLATAGGWAELESQEATDLAFSGAASIDAVLAEHPWLGVCERVAAQQGFFHWDLDFAHVFLQGGFDLQVGNPPWVRPDWDENAVYAEHDAWWQLAEKPPEAEKKRRIASAQADASFVPFLQNMGTEIQSTRAFFGSEANYPLTANLRTDLYRVFMERAWTLASPSGVSSLIHPESHFTEKGAEDFRAQTYCHLRRHWQFVNELAIFEIHHLVVYGVHVYGTARENIGFLMAAALYHPDTVARSLRHDGSGAVPGLKDEDNNWDTRPHSQRIIRVDEEVLATWAQVVDEPGTPAHRARMVYPVNTESQRVLEKLSTTPRVRELGLQFSSGWNETTDRKKGYFEVGSSVPETWDEAILQGPHFTVGTPFFKTANPTMKSNLDYTEIDLEALPADFIPRTNYQIACEREKYDRDYGTWQLPDGTRTPERDNYRLAWRRMAALTGERTLIPCIIPPGPCHIDNVFSTFVYQDATELLALVGLFSGLLADFQVRVSGNSKINSNLTESLPSVSESDSLIDMFVERAARLNCLTAAYAPLWEEAMGTPWTPDSPARKAAERRQLLVELDALAALHLGITADELCTIYRTQFGVLRQYERTDLYDANGRKLPKEVAAAYKKSGEAISTEERTWVHPQSGVEYVFELPFTTFDREADMRAAYARFEKMI